MSELLLVCFLAKHVDLAFAVLFFFFFSTEFPDSLYRSFLGAQKKNGSFVWDNGKAVAKTGDRESFWTGCNQPATASADTDTCLFLKFNELQPRNAWSCESCFVIKYNVVCEFGTV